MEPPPPPPSREEAPAQAEKRPLDAAEEAETAAMAQGSHFYYRFL